MGSEMCIRDSPTTNKIDQNQADTRTKRSARLHEPPKDSSRRSPEPVFKDAPASGRESPRETQSVNPAHRRLHRQAISGATPATETPHATRGAGSFGRFGGFPRRASSPRRAPRRGSCFEHRRSRDGPVTTEHRFPRAHTTHKHIILNTHTLHTHTHHKPAGPEERRGLPQGLHRLLPGGPRRLARAPAGDGRRLQRGRAPRRAPCDAGVFFQGVRPRRASRGDTTPSRTGRFPERGACVL